MSPRTPSTPRIDEHEMRALPKAEVHIHLEGTFSLIDLISFAKESDAPLPGPAATLFDITTHNAYAPPSVTTGGGSGVGAGGLTGFLRFLDWQCGLIRTPEQAARVAYSFAARQSASGVRYCDVIVNPTHWRAWHGRELQLLDALAGGFDAAEQDGLCIVNVAYSLLRSQSKNEADDIVATLVAASPRRVLALSVDGDEKVSGRTGEKFHDAFTAAAAAGLHRTVHAGESSGPEGVRDAVELLHAERIDHGVRAIEDPQLIDMLIDQDVSLGVCPRSNVALGIYPSWHDHPLAELVRQGVRVTLNTDDPAPLGTTLEQDWAVAAQEFGFTYAHMVGFAGRSIDASFADEDTKRLLHADLALVAAAR